MKQKLIMTSACFRRLDVVAHVVEPRPGDLLGQLTSSIEQADLGSKGVFYRLRVGPIPDMEAARKLCDALTQRKEACLIVRR